MGMLLHNTLMEQEAALRKAKAEKPVEVPEEVKEPETEQVKKPVGRRKNTSK